MTIIIKWDESKSQHRKIDWIRKITLMKKAMSRAITNFWLASTVLVLLCLVLDVSVHQNPQSVPQYRRLHGCSGGVPLKWYRKKPPQLSTSILMDQVQQFEPQLKQTFLVTLPSSTDGWAPLSQPVAWVLHLWGATHDVGIFVPALPWKRYHPCRSDLSQRSGDEPWDTFLSLLVNFR